MAFKLISIEFGKWETVYNTVATHNNNTNNIENNRRLEVTSVAIPPM